MPTKKTAKQADKVFKDLDKVLFPLESWSGAALEEMLRHMDLLRMAIDEEFFRRDE